MGTNCLQNIREAQSMHLHVFIITMIDHRPTFPSLESVLGFAVYACPSTRNSST